MICIYIYTYVLYIYYIYIFTYTYDNQSATCPPKELTLFPEELKVFKAAPERCPPAGCADVSWLKPRVSGAGKRGEVGGIQQPCVKVP